MNPLFITDLSEHILRMNWPTIALGCTFVILNHEHLIILTILTLSVIFMLLLQFACARLPTKISLIDRGNKEIHLIAWHVLEMEVASLVFLVAQLSQ